jgi:hypothetical protein
MMPHGGLCCIRISRGDRMRELSMLLDCVRAADGRVVKPKQVKVEVRSFERVDDQLVVGVGEDERMKMLMRSPGWMRWLMILALISS